MDIFFDFFFLKFCQCLFGTFLGPKEVGADSFDTPSTLFRY